MQTRTLILISVSIFAACSDKPTMTLTVDKEKFRKENSAQLATQLESIDYLATVTNEGETLLIRVGAASLPDVRRAMCRQMG